MNSQKLPELHQRLVETEEMLKHQAALTRGLQRLLWVIAHQAGGTLEIDESKLHELWEWTPERPYEDRPQIVLIRATTMPEPTESQVKQLAERLSGTADHPGDAMVALGLGDHPIAYMSRLLSPIVMLHEGAWMPRADYDALPADQKPPTPFLS